jgi:hypothetical protein
MADATYEDLLGSDILLHYDVLDAASLFTDTGGTSAASNGNEVRCIKPQSDAALQVNLTNSTGPTYRSNYASSGYPALEFDGVNDALLNVSTGITTGQRLFVLCAFTFIGSSNTLWCRGNGSFWCRGLCSTTVDGFQSTTSGGSAQTASMPAGRRVTAWAMGSSQSQVDALGFSAGNNANASDSMSGAFTLGALNTGSLSQYGNFAMHEVMVVAGSCEWGQVLRSAKIMRNRWGVTDPNATPQKAGGSSRQVNPFMQQVIG